jgi:endonuclease YncB( thermonuclease family)
VTGTVWAVDAVPRITDGDTVRLVRSRVIELDGRRYRLTDAEPTGVPIRLVWLDTPERGQPGYLQARDDLAHWIWDRADITVVCYESAGFDRLLGDLIDAEGNSASQYLMIECGWPAYDGGAL